MPFELLLQHIIGRRERIIIPKTPQGYVFSCPGANARNAPKSFSQRLKVVRAGQSESAAFDRLGNRPDRRSASLRGPNPREVSVQNLRG